MQSWARLYDGKHKMLATTIVVATAGTTRDGRAAHEPLQPQQQEHEQHQQQPHRLSAKLTPELIELLQPGGGLKGPPESLLALVEEDGTIRHPPSKIENPDGTSATLPQHLIQADGSLAGPPLDLLQKTADMYHGMEKHKDALDRAKSFSPEAVQVRGARTRPVKKHMTSLAANRICACAPVRTRHVRSALPAPRKLPPRHANHRCW